MARQRILLLEADITLRGVLCDLFEYEDLDVTVCDSLIELRAAIRGYPRAAVVSDWWAMGEYDAFCASHHAAIAELGRTAAVVITTEQRWGRKGETGLGGVAIVEKPYDMDRLMNAVRFALERSSRPPSARA